MAGHDGGERDAGRMDGGFEVAHVMHKEPTDQQQLFLDHFLYFGNATKAAEHAGYAHPERAALKVMSKPHIKVILNNAMRSRAMQYAPDMVTMLAQTALDVDGVQPKDRIAAAVALLDRAGISARDKVENNNLTVNVGTSPADVLRLIQQTFNQGKGGQTQIPQDGGQIRTIDVKPMKITDD